MEYLVEIGFWDYRVDLGLPIDIQEKGDAHDGKEGMGHPHLCGWFPSPDCCLELVVNIRSFMYSIAFAKETLMRCHASLK
jgi:hypothetical protein